MPDGSAPPHPVLIQQVCSGHARDAAWTDGAGRFSFKVDSNGSGGIGNDASDGPVIPGDFDKPIGNSTRYSNPINSSLRDCEIQAVLAGFRSDRVGIALRTTLDNTRLGTIILHPLTKADALTISATTLQAPASATKAYDKGMSAMKARKWHPAVVEFNKAVTAYPKFALAWYQLGVALQAQDDLAGAIDAWKHSLASDEHYVSPYEGLCSLAYQKNDWSGLAECSHNWIRLDADDFPAAYLYNAFANAKLNNMGDAEAMAREGLRIDKEHRFPRISFLLGMILMEKHQNAESAKYLRAYLEMAPKAADADAVRAQLARLDQATTTAAPGDGPAKP